MVPRTMLRYAFAAILAMQCGAFSPYPAQLRSLRFKNRGEVHASQTFKLVTIPSIYNEAYTYQGLTANGTSLAAWSNLDPSIVPATEGLDYLFLHDDQSGTLHTPPSGMRSSVPLGPLGEGSIELRADGRLADWGTIFNNGPYTSDVSWACKIDVDQAVFGVGVGESTTTLMRTHPPSGFEDFSVDSLTYQGAYPAARLAGQVKDMEVTMDAFSHFKMHTPNRSIAPVVYFAFSLTNQGNTSLNASLFFNMPDILGGAEFMPEGQGFTLTTSAATQPSALKQGSLHYGIVNSTAKTQWDVYQTDSLEANWAVFSQGVALREALAKKVSSAAEAAAKAAKAAKAGGASRKEVGVLTGEAAGKAAVAAGASAIEAAQAASHWSKREGAEVLAQAMLANEMVKEKNPVQSKNIHGASTVHLEVPAGKTETVTLALSWYYPHRQWSDGSDLGHFYENFYSDARDVVQKEGPRLTETMEAILAWQAVCFDNEFNDTVQDSLVNTPATWGKTSFYGRDGRWRNFESHSCTQMEPPHIHFYRALGYSLFMPSLERQTPTMYAESISRGDGVNGAGALQELFGCNCGTCPGDKSPSTLDIGFGNQRGDDNPAFILDVYMNWKWAADTADADAWLHSPAVANGTVFALQYMINNAPTPFYLPYRMINTNDEHGVIGDVNSYSAFIYLSALAAGKELAAALGNEKLRFDCELQETAGKEALHELLWNEEHEFFAQAWCEAALPYGTPGAALQGGVLYGHLWGKVLGLPTHTTEAELHRHLNNERERNSSPLGLIFATNRTLDYYQGHCAPLTEATAYRPSTIFAAYGGSNVLQGMKTDFVDQDVWNSHSITHAAVSIYSGFGSVSDAVAVAELVIDTYQTTMADQWDYRDTTTPYDSDGRYSPTGLPRPSVNSHYARQTIWWALPLAASGQQYDARRKTLSFELAEATSTWPLLLPAAAAVVSRQEQIASAQQASLCLQFDFKSGTLDLAELTVTVKMPEMAVHCPLKMLSIMGAEKRQIMCAAKC